ncbi:uncharacterized protein [Triticum aestivum]|uniref:uncharacterized protein isoform X2 n=1 Tax=Triticum aestivum TaxID=4565 RepID=UPI001D0130B8|nr:uncharacterized protein LOC123123163 isoform X2 [Triticum aestivum]
MSTSTTITPLLCPSPRQPGLLTSPWRSPHPRAPDYPPAPPLPAYTCHLAVTSTDEREADEEFVVVTYNLVPVDDPRAPLHFLQASPALTGHALQYEQSLIQPKRTKWLVLRVAVVVAYVAQAGGGCRPRGSSAGGRWRWARRWMRWSLLWVTVVELRRWPEVVASVAAMQVGGGVGPDGGSRGRRCWTIFFCCCKNHNELRLRQAFL